MNDRKGLSVAVRLGLAFTSLIVFMGIIIGVALNNFTAINATLQDITTVNNVASRQASQLLDATELLRIGYRAIIIAEPTEMEAAMGKYNAAKALYLQREKILSDFFLSQTGITQHEKDLLTQVQSLRPNVMMLADQGTTLGAQNKKDDAKHVLLVALDQPMTQFRSAIDDLASYEIKLSDEAAANAQQNYINTRSQMIELAVAAVVIAIVIALLIMRNLLRTLGGEPAYVAGLMRELSAGNLMVSVRLRHGDTSSLAYAISQMVDKLRSIIGEVKSSADNLSAAAQQLSSTSQTLSQGATESAAGIEETSASIEETSSSIEEISSSIEQISSSINQTNDNARVTESMATKASREAAEGGESVRQTVQAMRQIAEKIGIVDDIAYQTNLLALNAAIEAARAGEHGKGFAVVAAEVRKLAERSQVAAQNISEVAQNSVSLAERAGQLLEEIVRSSSRTSDLVQEIAAASNEQASGVGQVNTAVQQLSGNSQQLSSSTQQLNMTTQQNAAASEELASTAEEMSSQAELLQDLMEFFRLDEGPARRKQAPPKARQLRSGRMVRSSVPGDPQDESDFQRF